MKKIHENYLLLTSMKEFDFATLKYFADRLSIFLCKDLDSCPDVLFTSDEKRMAKHYGYKLDDGVRAFFDEEDSLIVFKASKYDIKSKDFFDDKEYIIKEIGEDYYKKYKYVVPISDIYHELVHFFQYEISDKYEEMKYTDLIEASDDIYTYFLTGQIIDYEKHAMGLWYFSKYYLKLRGMKFYMFMRDIIIDPNWEKNYLLVNKDIIKMLAEEYNGKLDNFLSRLKIDFYYKDYLDEFYKDLNEIHDLIFYRW